jgi:putative FmdB family regulatory protein
MPMYEYRCRNCGERTELLQHLDEPRMTVCPRCGGAVDKMASAPALKFKGSGFYVTDYARGGAADQSKELAAKNSAATSGKNASATSSKSASGSSSKGDSGSSSKSDSGSSKGSEKPASSPNEQKKAN